MKIEIKSPQSVYIIIDNHTYYIDNSTNEQIMEKWETNCYYVKNSDTGNIIKSFLTLSEAEQIVSEYEADDIREGNYIDNLYEIVKL